MTAAALGVLALIAVVGVVGFFCPSALQVVAPAAAGIVGVAMVGLYLKDKDRIFARSLKQGLIELRESQRPVIAHASDQHTDDRPRDSQTPVALEIRRKG